MLGPGSCRILCCPVSASDYPQLLDIDSEDDRTVLVNARSVREHNPEDHRDRYLLVRIEGELLGQVTQLQGEEIVVGRAQPPSLFLTPV